MPTDKRLNLRVPEDVYERAAAAAAGDHRSLNNYVTMLLDRVLPPVQPALFDDDDMPVAASGAA